MNNTLNPAEIARVLANSDPRLQAQRLRRRQKLALAFHLLAGAADELAEGDPEDEPLLAVAREALELAVGTLRLLPDLPSAAAGTSDGAKARPPIETRDYPISRYAGQGKARPRAQGKSPAKPLRTHARVEAKDLGL